MRKSDKKIDNQLRLILTDLCERYYEQVTGFKWLTHIVDYHSFPNSLKIVCVFETQQDIQQFLALDKQQTISSATALSFLAQQLSNMGVKIKKLDKLICYDDEQSCLNKHDGNWAKRLN